MKRKALFVTYGGGHVTMILPVIRALRAQWPEVEGTLLALTTAEIVPGFGRGAGDPRVEVGDHQNQGRGDSQKSRGTFKP